jgi:FdrA protein
MITGCVIRKNEYHDSVFLMRVAKRLSEQKGVLQTAALMGTEKNKGLLAEIGVSDSEISSAAPTDLIIAIKAETNEILVPILENIDPWLHFDLGRTTAGAVRTLDEAIIQHPHSNLAVISVPGQYAGQEAQKALNHGLNVFLFSDNVPLETELSLKVCARGNGLIIMGPDCGTAIIGGIGVGFANVVRRGPIGIIGSSGTGIQEVTTLVHHSGSGISHAIGTGSRDLSDAIGGITFLSALEALESDRETQVIVILCKPPGVSAFRNLIEKIIRCQKPIVTCFLGLKEDPPHANIRYRTARTLEDTAALAVQIATGHTYSPSEIKPPEFQQLIKKEKAGKRPEQKYIRGVFAGGTFCYQAQQILQDSGIFVRSNVPLKGNLKLSDPLHSVEHTLVDMGADEFTAGRPHPMIDPGLRYERILEEAEDPQVSILLLDFILGFNASPNPAGELLPAINHAKLEAKMRSGSLSVVASVCGTEKDPQNLEQQLKMLEEAGVIVFSSSSQAAKFCALLLASSQEEPRVR